MTPDMRQLFKELPERIQQAARPSLRMKTTALAEDSLAMGQTRIGGAPDLPPGFEWPYYNGLPLSFIAQLNLAELAMLPPVLSLPMQGSLVFFYDSEQRTWGFDPKDRGSALVSYLPDSIDSLVRTQLPSAIPNEGRFQCCAVEFSIDQNLPDFLSAHFIPHLTETEQSQLFNFVDRQSAQDSLPRHRIGGQADCVQNSMELECQLVTSGLYCGNETGYEDPRAQILAERALDWRLLLQIDSDDNPGMMWGDVGMIYFWIREDDLRAASFENIWLILQCC